jgi:hypothetical protein
LNDVLPEPCLADNGQTLAPRGAGVSFGWSQ